MFIELLPYVISLFRIVVPDKVVRMTYFCLNSNWLPYPWQRYAWYCSGKHHYRGSYIYIYPLNYIANPLVSVLVVSLVVLFSVIFFLKMKILPSVYLIHIFDLHKSLIHVVDGDSIITSVLWCITTCFYFCNYRMYWIMLDGVLWRRNELFCLEWPGLSSSRRQASVLRERPFCNSGLGLLIGYRYSGSMGCCWFLLEWHLRPSQYKTIYQFVFFIRKVQLHITLHAVYRALW